MAATNFQRSRSRLGQTGFTLIELIVVLAIVSLVLALVVPNVGRRSGNFALAATAHNVAMILRFTRDQAIVRSQPARFVGNAVDFGGGAGGQVWHAPQGITLTYLGSDPRATPQPSGTISFYPDGSSTGGAIALTAGAMRYTVRVAWINGNVSIQSEPTPH